MADDYLHRMGVATTNLKLRTYFWTGVGVHCWKFCDFDFIKHTKYQSNPKRMVDTLHYAAPIILQLSTYDGKVGLFRLAYLPFSTICFFDTIYHPELACKPAPSGKRCLGLILMVFFTMMTVAYPFTRDKGYYDVQRLHRLARSTISAIELNDAMMKSLTDLLHGITDSESLLSLLTYTHL